MTRKQQLQATRELIADPSRWTQEVPARTKNGAECGAFDEAAVSWCVEGAWRRVTGSCDAFDLRCLLDDEPMEINDEQGHAAVLALLDSAIERETR